MAAVGWVVYSGAIAAVVIVLGLLLWTLHDRLEREMSDEFVAAYAQKLRQLDNHGEVESESNFRGDPGNMIVLRPLPTAESTRFVEHWRSLQPLFVNDPDDAVKEADRLIYEVMQTRGYPMSECAQRAKDISVDHPDIVSHYRAAHRLAQRVEDGQATTDEERQALVEFRELFNELLDNAPTDVSPPRAAQTGKSQ